MLYVVFLTCELYYFVPLFREVVTFIYVFYHYYVILIACFTKRVSFEPIQKFEHTKDVIRGRSPKNRQIVIDKIPHKKVKIDEYGLH